MNNELILRYSELDAFSDRVKGDAFKVMKRKGITYDRCAMIGGYHYFYNCKNLPTILPKHIRVENGSIGNSTISK